MKTKSDYNVLLSYFTNLKDLFGLDLTLKDYTGFIAYEPHFEVLVRPYIAHSSPYCLFVKETEKGYTSCLNYKDVLYEKCKNEKWFLSRCPAGIEELVIPIVVDHEVFGSLNISNFDKEYMRAHQKIREFYTDDDSGMVEKALRIFSLFVRPSLVEMNFILPSLLLAADYIEKMIAICKEPIQPQEVVFSTSERVKDYLLQHIGRKILKGQLLDSLHLSENELQTIIQEKMCKNFRDLVNSVRIEESEKMLLEKNKTPKEVALLLGFKDYNHFSSIFEEKIKITPDNYRKYYLNEKFNAAIR